MEKTVYLLEDDEDISELVECSLSAGSVFCRSFSTVAAFKKAVEKEPPSVALLDIMLSDGNGLDVLKWLKSRGGDVYCIMLSALGKETDKVKGLNLGADDYIAKPFGALELSAKINAVFRRLGKASPVVSAEGIVMDLDSMTATLDGEPLPLSVKEFNLLRYALENRGKVLTRDAILTNVWGYEGGETRTVDNYVAHLRKLGITGFETVFGIGYRFRTEKQ